MASTLLIAALLILNVNAQIPYFEGPLLIQPIVNNLKCIAALSGNANGSGIGIADCAGGQDQQFTFVNGTVRAYETKCLDVVDGKDGEFFMFYANFKLMYFIGNGSQLQLWDCAVGNANQQWYWTPDNQLATLPS